MRGPGRVQRERDRLQQIADDWPSVHTDAHDWLADDDRFVRLVRDIIAVSLQEPGRMGPRPAPTPDQARAEWARLVAALRP